MPRVPDGRTVLTEPEALNSCNGSIVATRQHLRPFIPDTNAIEALNRQLRKAIKTKGSFPNEDAARKLVYLALAERRSRNGREPGTGRQRCWRSRSTSVTASRMQTDSHKLTLSE